MTNRITEITRHRISDVLDQGGSAFWWCAQLDEHEFLARLYPLNEMPSTDHRYRDAEGDIRQHCVTNLDWRDDWVFHDPRFGLADGPDDILLRFLAEMLHPIVRPDASTVRAMLTALNEALAPDGYELFESTSISGRPVYSYRDRAGFHQNTNALLEERPKLNDPRVLQEHLDRIDRGINGDPAAAIGSCKELVESLCKLILDQEGTEHARGDDLPALYKKVALELHLNAESVPDNARGSAAAQRVLRTLTTTVQSLAELRNELGLGHGRTQPSSLQPRHARRAFNSTVTITEFLLDTWHERARRKGL